MNKNLLNEIWNSKFGDGFKQSLEEKIQRLYKYYIKI